MVRASSKPRSGHVADGDARTHHRCNLRRHLPDAPGPADDQQALAHAQLGIAATAHRHPAHAEQRGVHRVDVRGQLEDQVVLGNGHKLHVTGRTAPRSTVGADEHQVAKAQILDLGSEGDHLADALVALVRGQLVVRAGVVAAQHVVALGAVGDAAVDVAGLDLVGPWLVRVLGPVMHQPLAPASVVLQHRH